MRHPTESDRRCAAHFRCREEVSQPFDLVEGPLFRMGAAKLAAAEHALLLTVHHIICDGCSLGVLVEELGKAYSLEDKAEKRLEELPMSYSQFVEEQEASLRTSQRSEAEARASIGIGSDCAGIIVGCPRNNPRANHA